MAITLRWLALGLSAIPTALSAWLFVVLARADGWTALDTLRLVLSTACVFWIAWGAVGGLLGLFARRLDRPERAGPSGSRTAILMPIYNEDPPSTFARIAAVSGRLAALDAHEGFDFFILSDSQSVDAAAREALWLDRLLTDCSGREHIFYRRRAKNTARKAGNIEDFIVHSGGAYDYALVLDADSLMDAESILTMVRRMDGAPRLGLLQTLPTIVHGRSVFGRALQFATHFYTPVYARGTALLQGREGPYWGHNAIFRIAAFAQHCGLPELGGKPPFGGQVLSHDYVEAALLARAGWQVRLDPDIVGSYEEGPDNIIAFAKRDQRWCQGNLQHSRIVVGPGFRLWNRLTLLQGILSYLMPPVWLALLAISLASADMIRRPAAKPGTDWAGWSLIGIVAGMLILPKLLIGIRSLLLRETPVRAAAWLFGAVLGEIALSTLAAPIVLMFQVRAVLRVVLGFDGGWPPSNRTDGGLSLTEAWAGTWWISACGAASLALVLAMARPLAEWSIPVALPMLAAPLIVAASSHRLGGLARLWQVPADRAPSPVLTEWHSVHDSWTGPGGPSIDPGFAGGAANVLG